MSKTKKVDAGPGDYIARHELHLGDPDGLGKNIIPVGGVVPLDAFDEETLERMVAKGSVAAPPASKKAAAKAEASATREDLDEITGTAGDDGLGDEGGDANLSGVDASEGGEGKGAASTSVPGTKATKSAGSIRRVGGTKR